MLIYFNIAKTNFWKLQSFYNSDAENTAECTIYLGNNNILIGAAIVSTKKTRPSIEGLVSKNLIKYRFI